MNAKGKLYGISLGPGDPGLITVKGLQILQQADSIYYPGSLLKNGSTSSYSLTILNAYNLDNSKLKGMFLNMSADRAETLKLYEQTFYAIKNDYEKGYIVAFVSEGDISFYSTFAYLLKHIHEHNLTVELIAGVPSFLLAGAAHQLPLALLNDKIIIVPRIAEISELLRYTKEFETVILIKIASVIKLILNFLNQQQLSFIYAERLGTTAQYLTTELNVLNNRIIPYFSLIIIKRNNL